MGKMKNVSLLELEVGGHCGAPLYLYIYSRQAYLKLSSLRVCGCQLQITRDSHKRTTERSARLHRTACSMVHQRVNWTQKVISTQKVKGWENDAKENMGPLTYQMWQYRVQWLDLVYILEPIQSSPVLLSPLGLMVSCGFSDLTQEANFP